MITRVLDHHQITKHYKRNPNQVTSNGGLNHKTTSFTQAQAGTCLYKQQQTSGLRWWTSRHRQMLICDCGVGGQGILSKEALRWKAGGHWFKSASALFCFVVVFFTPKVVVSRHCLVTWLLTVNETLKSPASLPTLTHKSFWWWWQLGIRYSSPPHPTPTSWYLRPHQYLSGDKSAVKQVSHLRTPVRTF